MYVHTYVRIAINYTKLSFNMIVLNSRDWSEKARIFEISHFKKQPSRRFYPKNYLESINIAVVITRISKTKQKVE